MAESHAATIPPGTILMLTPDRNIDRRILNEADALGAAGWTVTIVAMPRDADDTVDDARVMRVRADAPEARRESRVLDLYRRIRARLPMNGPLMRLMKRVAWSFVVDPESFHRKLMHATAARHPARVVVAHDLPMLPLAAELSAEWGAKLVYDSHELYAEQDLSEPERRRWREVEAKYIGRCDVVITINRSIARELQERHALPRVDVILNAERSAGAPEPSRYFHAHFGLPPESRVLLMQGGISAGRNIEALVAAMRHVANPQVVLVILGDGALLSALAHTVAGHRLERRVLFHAAVPQRQLLALSAAADAGVIPYRATCLNNRLCTPNKLFEFIAAGVPVLASDLPELRRFVVENGIGRVADLDGAFAIATAIDAFFADEERLAQWRHRVIEARSRICWEVEATKLVDIYEALR